MGSELEFGGQQQESLGLYGTMRRILYSVPKVWRVDQCHRQQNVDLKNTTGFREEF